MKNCRLYGIQADLYMSEHLELALGVFVYGVRHV